MRKLVNLNRFICTEWAYFSQLLIRQMIGSFSIPSRFAASRKTRQILIETVKQRERRLSVLRVTSRKHGRPN